MGSRDYRFLNPGIEKMDSGIAIAVATFEVKCSLSSRSNKVIGRFFLSDFAHKRQKRYIYVVEYCYCFIVISDCITNVCIVRLRLSVGYVLPRWNKYLQTEQSWVRLWWQGLFSSKRSSRCRRPPQKQEYQAIRTLRGGWSCSLVLSALLQLEVVALFCLCLLLTYSFAILLLTQQNYNIKTVDSYKNVLSRVPVTGKLATIAPVPAATCDWLMQSRDNVRGVA